MVNHQKKKETVSIIGLGYVGLPLACLCAEKKYKTYAIDIDKRKLNLIKKGISPIKDENLQKELSRVKIIPTDDFQVISRSDIIIICVPTPIEKNHNPNLKPLRLACQTIQKNLRENHLVIVESTINPGTCEEIVQPILEKSGLKAGIDFDIAHCPERINPGDKKWTIRNIPRIIGASSTGLKKAMSFYRSILSAKIMPMKSIKTAEATKIIENTFRDINIAFVNELAKSFDKMGIDLFEVIKGASTKPFAFLPHFPGCGVGGHCIPVDPYYLIKHAQKNGFNHRFLKLAREINNSMPVYTVDLLVKELNNIGKSIKGTNVGIMGLAYKPNVGDIRESPVYKIIKLLKDLKATVNIYDFFVLDQSTVKSLNELLKKSEVLILATAHQEFVNMDLSRLKDNKIKIIIDGRNCLNKKRIQGLGIIYKGIGR